MRLVMIAVLAVLVSVAGALGQEDVMANLMTNGDFEAEDAGGWKFNEQRRVEEVEDAPSGTHALVMECKEAAYYFAIAGPDVPIKARTLYRIRLKIKRTSGGGYLRVGGGYLDAEKKGLMRGSWSFNTYPINMTPGEGSGTWLEQEGTFLCKRADVAFLAFRIIIKDGVDTVYVDDVSIEEVERQEAPPLTLPDQVQWPGHPSTMGMAVESAEVTDAGVVAVTTGARYEFGGGGESLTCYQRIPAEREVASFRFDPPLGALTLGQSDADVAVLMGDECALSVNGDGLVALGTNRKVSITVTSAIVPEHYRLASDNLLAIDETGGFCLYPEQRHAYETEPSVFSAEPEDTSAAGWSATLEAGARKRVAIAVFPPKEFPWEQSFTDRIAHSNHFPADDSIRWMAEYCNIMVLHQSIYEGAKSSGPYVIKDDAEYARTIATAHEAGLQVLPYFNPGAYSVQDVDLAIKLLADHREKYGTDGFYFDGLYRKNEWPKSYYFIRRIREMVGENCIYAHTTLNPPVNSPSIYCPFIDAYCDFMLRGEGQRIDGPEDPYMRYVIGTWNISNCISTLKGDKMEGADERAQLEAMLELNGRARWGYPGINAERDTLFTGWYFPRLDELYEAWQAEQAQ